MTLYCRPQRFLANDRNLVRDAVLTASSVLPIDNHVTPEPRERRGTAEARITGAYGGAEESTLELEILDTIPDDPIVSFPVFQGAGSAQLVDVAAVGLPSQTIIVELVDAGAPATYAAVSFEGVTLRARVIGSAGNLINLSIDQSAIVYGPSDYSLLVDLKAGQGAPDAGVEGPENDWDTKILGADDVIPDDAHRVAFGEDRTIYLQYKKYVDNRWTYHLVPALKRDVPKGTPIKFVTGGRTVTVTDGVTPETYIDVETVYDFLIGLRTDPLSQLLIVDGVVANDRTPTGQAARELAVRTDAHVQPSTGSGSPYATGFIDTFANDNARTELVVAKCFANTSKDHPLARLGSERWEVSSSLGGVIGEAITGVAFVDPSATPPRFGFTIEKKLPPGYGGPRGLFSWVEDRPVPRDEGEPDMPPSCKVGMRLGPEARDGLITLRWTRRPSGNCDCKDLPVPFIGGPCLGVEGGGEEGTMDYNVDARLRVKALYAWGNELSSALARYVAGKQRDGIPETTFAANTLTASTSVEEGIEISIDPAATGAFDIPHDAAVLDTTFADDVTAQLLEVLDIYELGIQALNEVIDTALASDGWTQWDAALDQWKGDFQGSVDLMSVRLKSFAIEKYRILVREAIAAAGVSPMGKSDAGADDSGDGCWRDWNDPYYFTVELDTRGGYAPLFVNHPYYSSRRATEEGKYFATMEFGLQLNVVKACIAHFKEGDEIILQIGDAGFASTYQNGDTNTLPVVAAQALALAGGRPDNSTQTYSVTGSDFGPFPPWLVLPGSTGNAYSEDGLSFDYVPGGIPNLKGDRWTLELTGGHWQWRQNGGAWQGPLSIESGPVALVDGLFVEFVPGAAPVFFPGDTYAFLALQPNAVSNLTTPRPQSWRPAIETPDVAEVLADFGSVQDVDIVALVQHSIAAGATITVAGGPTDPPVAWTHTITWRPWLIVQPLPQVEQARYLKVTITDGNGGGVGWFWAGIGLSTEYPARVKTRPTFRIGRGDANTQSGTTFGSGRGADVVFGPSYLSDVDKQALDEMAWYVKTNDDEALVMMPNINRPEDSLFGLIGVDVFDWEDKTDEQATDGTKRRYAVEFPIIPIWQR